MYTIGLGFLGMPLMYTGHLFRTDGPVWLGFGLIICGVIIDLVCQKPVKEEIYDGRSII